MSKLRPAALATLVLSILSASSCANLSAPPDPDVQDAAVNEPLGSVELERITTAVPWPRGVRYIDGKLYALARGAHRSAGGPQSDIEDQAGTIFRIDPKVSEPVQQGRPIGDAVRGNAEVVAAPTSPPFRAWNRIMPATEDRHTDRPYCMLVYDKMSRNFFVCGYSGIDLLEAPQFRKNATDSVHRFDLRSGQWKVVEAHDPRVVPVAALKKDVSSVYYPHHDISKHNPPHGLVNGPCGAVIAGSCLYVGAKDNTALACYDISEIRRNPDAPPPPGHFIFEGTKGHAEVAIEGHGQMVVNGTCALASHGGYLYVAFRTTSQILRFPLQADGSLKQPLKGQYIAQFSRHDPDKGGGSANIYDMTFDGEGRCYVSPGYDGAIYRFQPDPAKLYRADQVDYQPYVDLNALVGAKKSGNICFDDEGNLYICSGQKVLDDSKVRGVIYRVRPR